MESRWVSLKCYVEFNLFTHAKEATVSNYAAERRGPILVWHARLFTDDPLEISVQQRR